MFIALIRGVSAEFIHEQTLAGLPIEDNVILEKQQNTLYGRAVAMATTNEGHRRVVVGAEYQTVNGFSPPENWGVDDYLAGKGANELYHHGLVYVYDYDPNTQQYVKKATLDGMNHEDQNGVFTVGTEEVYTRNLGSTLEISSDGNRIFAGAPKTHVKLNADEKFRVEVGAVFVFDYDSTKGQWSSPTILIPKAEDVVESNGLGRSLTITPDGQNVASSYYNKRGAPGALKNTIGDVFISTFSSNKWSTLAKLAMPTELKNTVFDIKTVFTTEKGIDLTIGYYRKWGSGLQFGSSTQLLVATENSKLPEGHVVAAIPTQVYEYVENVWTRTGQVDGTLYKGTDYSSFGGTISVNSIPDRLMTIRTLSQNKVSTSELMLVKKVENGKWDSSYEEVVMPEGTALGNVAPLFCGDYLLSADSGFSFDGHKSVGTAVIYKLNANKAYEVFQRVIPPKESYENLESNTSLTFGTALYWDQSCNYFAVGAMNGKRGGPSPRAFVYRFQAPSEKKDGLTNTEITIISVCTVVGVIVIAVACVSIWYCRRKRTSDQVEA